MNILDGRAVADARATLLQARVSRLGFAPKIVIVRVGDRSDSKSYVARKVAYAKTVGVVAEVSEHPADISQPDLTAVVRSYNDDPHVQGIIVQLPLPEHIDAKAIIDTIAHTKDVDGLSDYNIAQLAGGEAGIVPATPRGILTLLEYYQVPISGSHVVVIGRSRLVGKSVSLLLLNHDATVTMCHSKTKQLSAITRMADILIVATGRQKFVTAEHVRTGQVIIDVGIGTDDDNKLVGDVDTQSLHNLAVHVTPVPGGVGPMTVAALFENLLDVAERQQHHH